MVVFYDEVHPLAVIAVKVGIDNLDIFARGDGENGAIWRYG